MNIMPQLTAAIGGDSRQLTEECCLELHSLAVLLKRARWRRVTLAAPSRSVIVISDAMWAPPAESRLCYIVIPDDAPGFGRCLDIPPSFGECCTPRETQIMMAELVAPLIAIRSFPALFEGRAATFFNDNVAAVSALVLGASRAQDLSCLGLAFNLIAHSLSATCWHEWVPSASNIADDGSRRGAAETTAQAMGIAVSPQPFPPDISQLLRTSPRELALHILG